MANERKKGDPKSKESKPLPLTRKTKQLKEVGHFPSEYDGVRRAVYMHDDHVARLVKTPSDRLEVTITVQIKGKIRRADLDRFTQTMGKTAAFEFENGGGGV